ncbi:MAG: DUF58 domain-containing protein [Spirochaetes bacterium]|nr:DUF58 domain-containing protein [Spirochaetota bacterium]
MNIKAENIPFTFPGIYFLIKFDIYNENNLADRALVTVRREKEKLEFKYKFNMHGDFTIKNIKFILRDIFGFTEFSYNIRSTFKITVYPYYNDNVNVPFFNNKDGSEILQSVIRINSTDFFENRKYYPGDDPRKINWKIFAHIKELHVREIEKIPPKTGQIYVIFAPFSDFDIEFEYITSLFITTADLLLKYGIELKILSPISENEIIINKSNESEFNNIINYSFKKINIIRNKTIDNAIFFASFYEYSRIIESNLIKNSFAAITFFDDDNIKINDLALFLNINKYDSLIKDFIEKIKISFKTKKRYNILEKINTISENNKIKLEIYKTGNYFETKNNS